MGNLTNAAPAAPRAIELPLPWGPVVRGTAWGEGPTPIFLLHEVGADIDTWGDLPGLLARALPVQVIAYDLPGHGLSDEPWEAARLPQIVEAVAGLSAPGAKPIVIAAGECALASLMAADRLQLSALVAMSPFGPESQNAVPRSQGTAKAFIAGSQRESDLDVARQLAAECGGWSSVTSIPVDARGTALLRPPWGGRIREHILGFVRDCVYRRAILPSPAQRRPRER